MAALTAFEVEAYSEAYLRRVLGDSDAVAYLRDYLGDIKAASVVLEGRYVDRHYLGDFSAYYSRSFSAPKTHCKRLHFFAIDLDATRATFEGAYRDHKSRETSES